VRGGGTVEKLLEILAEPLAGPALRAAAFDALAEIPDIGFERGVADGAGRKGDAIGWTRGEGFGRRFIFDPRSSKILSEGEVVFDAKAAGYPKVPDVTRSAKPHTWGRRSSIQFTKQARISDRRRSPTLVSVATPGLTFVSWRRSAPIAARTPSRSTQDTHSPST
jgi:hypothetical protein